MKSTYHTAPPGCAALLEERLPDGGTRWHWQGPKWRPVTLGLPLRYLALLRQQEGLPPQADPRQVFGLRPTGELSLMGDEYARATGWCWFTWLYYCLRSRWRSWRIAGWRWLFARLTYWGWMNWDRVDCSRVQSGWAVLRAALQPRWPLRWRGIAPDDLRVRRRGEECLISRREPGRLDASGELDAQVERPAVYAGQQGFADPEEPQG